MPLRKKWHLRAARRCLAKKGVHVHVSTSHLSYATAFRYLILPSTKKPRAELACGSKLYLSKDHPDRATAAVIPRTAKASAAAAAAAAEAKEKKKRGVDKRVRAGACRNCFGASFDGESTLKSMQLTEV